MEKQHQGSEEAEGVGGNVSKSFYCGFCGKEQVRQGRKA